MSLFNGALMGRGCHVRSITQSNGVLMRGRNPVATQFLIHLCRLNSYLYDMMVVALF